MPHDAVAFYHDLLTDGLAAESQAWLDELQRRGGLTFGGRPLCTALRPRFLTPDQLRFLQSRVRPLLRAFTRCHAAALADAAFRRQFRLTEPEEALLAIDPGFRCPMPTSRLDAFYGPDGELRFTEYNAETPAGAAYGDALAEAFVGLPVWRAFSRRYRAYPTACRPGVLHSLLDAFGQWRGRSEPPRVAILDWREVPTWSEFVLFERYFKGHGLECVLADPREVEYRDGRLTAGDFPVTLIYKRVLVGELLERCGMESPVVRAVRDGAVCMVNPFRCKALYKKASLAVLSDERNARLFTPEEAKAIAAHVPWTRVVEERRTGFEGQVVDLVPFVLANKDRLVLKPNDDYGGRGVVLGWAVDAARWEQAVGEALQHPSVVQERIALPSEPFPSVIDGRVQFADRMYDTAPFVVHGDYVDGCLTRIAADPLLNVTAGGGSTVPTFVVEPR
jgi:uncharacterized circularly permuted ATP-grasp superfamily protein